MVLAFHSRDDGDSRVKSLEALLIQERATGTTTTKRVDQETLPSFFNLLTIVSALALGVQVTKFSPVFPSV